MFGRTDMKPTRARAVIALAGLACVLALAGCSPGAPAPAPSPAPPTPKAVATSAPCLAQLPVTAVDVKGMDVQLIGTGDNAVVVSNQSGNDLCLWADLAGVLSRQGYRVALYDYIGTESDDAVDVLDYVRSHGARTAALLGGSQGAKASIIAATQAKPAPDDLVALSGEEFLEGIDVADVVPKLTCPTFYLTAEHDPYGATSANQNFQKATKPGLSTLEVLPGSDHGEMLLKDPGVQDHVLAFLAAHLDG